MISAEEVAVLERMRSEGYSQRKVADFLGVTRDVVRYWDNPERRRRLQERNRANRKRPEAREAERVRSSKRNETSKQLRRENGYNPRDLTVPEGYSKELWEWAVRVVGTSKSRRDVEIQWVYAKLAAGVCEATGVPFKFTQGLFMPSLDRVVSGGPYNHENCQVTTLGYNLMKNRFSNEEAQEWLFKSTPGG